jgi:hypothetical protein
LSGEELDDHRRFRGESGRDRKTREGGDAEEE